MRLHIPIPQRHLIALILACWLLALHVGAYHPAIDPETAYALKLSSLIGLAITVVGLGLLELRAAVERQHEREERRTQLARPSNVRTFNLESYRRGETLNAIAKLKARNERRRSDGAA